MAQDIMGELRETEEIVIQKVRDSEEGYIEQSAPDNKSAMRAGGW